MNIDEIPGWFSPENRAGLADLIERRQCTSGIEIGCFLGLSTVWLAMHLHRLQCVDTWRENELLPGPNNLVRTLKSIGCPYDFYHVWEGNCIYAGTWPKITPIRGASADVHGSVVDADIVYIDGGHEYDQVCEDIRLYGPKARKVLCGDDFVVRDGFGVVEAVRDLLPQAKSMGSFWWVEK